MTNWDDIRNEWETSKITFKDLAEKHDVKLGTLKSRRSREKWSRDATKKKDATLNEKMQPEKEEKEPVVKSGNLTEKQRLFCIYYIKYFNATKAYQKAYECAYSTAMVEGHRHLRKPNITAAIDRMKAEQANELKLDVRDVLQKYIDIAFADITDFVKFGQKPVEGQVLVGFDEEDQPIYKKSGRTYNFVDFRNHDEIDGTIITEVKQGKDGISVKLADKMKALEMLSKYFDLLSDNDKKRLQEEKLKVEISKTNAEIDKLNDQGDSDKEKDVAAALRGLVNGVNSQTD